MWCFSCGIVRSLGGGVVGGGGVRVSVGGLVLLAVVDI